MRLGCLRLLRVSLKLLSSVAVAIHGWDRGSRPRMLETCFQTYTEELLGSDLRLKVSRFTWAAADFLRLQPEINNECNCLCCFRWKY